MVKTICSFCREHIRLTFSRILCLLLIFIFVIPSSLLYHRIMTLYKADMVQTASGSAKNVVAVNNNVLDLSLKRIEDLSDSMLSNRSLYESFYSLPHSSVSSYMAQDREVGNTMAGIFRNNDMIYHKFLYTPQWIFTYNQRNSLQITLDNLPASPFIGEAGQAAGSAHWITGVDYADYLPASSLGKNEAFYRFPLTMVREMNFKYSSQGVLYSLPASEQAPVLVVQVLESTIKNLYLHTLEYEDQLYGIVNENGSLISSNSDLLPLGTRPDPKIFSFTQSSQYENISFSAEEYLLCYDTMPGRGWVSFTLIPLKALTQSIDSKMETMRFYTILILGIASVLISALLSYLISRPVKTLTEAAKRVSKGDFRADTPVSGIDDFRLLTQTFNNMEVKITQLIEENYGISLREKESRITALSLQLNPHFLYNTMHLINILAIEHDEDGISDLIVSLSEILHFTFKEKREKIPLRDEIHWLGHYLSIMQKRFQGVFDVIWEIPGSMQDCRVPKFFLQPFAENSILHGFEGWQTGGHLRISAAREDDRLVLTISDNGNGMTPQQLQKCLTPASSDTEVGVPTVYRRLKLIYAEAFDLSAQSSPGTGTSFILKIPFEI